MLDSLIVHDAVAQMGLQRCLATSCSMIAHVLISRLRRSRLNMSLILAVSHLRKYEHLERISLLLELAAWKATCIVDLEESISVYDMME